MPSPISQLSSAHWVEAGPSGSPIYTMFVTESWPSSPERRNLVFPQAPIRLCLSQPISPRPTPHCLIRACVWASLPRREAPPLTPLFSLGRWVFLRSWRRGERHPPPVLSPGTLVLLDGMTGEIVIDPTPELVASVATATATSTAVTGAGATGDGYSVPLLANIGGVSDVAVAV